MRLRRRRRRRRRRAGGALGRRGAGGREGRWREVGRERRGRGDLPRDNHILSSQHQSASVISNLAVCVESQKHSTCNPRPCCTQDFQPDTSTEVCRCFHHEWSQFRRAWKVDKLHLGCLDNPTRVISQATVCALSSVILSKVFPQI